MTTQSPRQWDFGRFIKTLSYFGAVPFLSSIDWFQQWFGSRPDPQVDSRSLSLAPVDASGPIGKSGGSVLVIGATGKVGNLVVQELLAQGFSVILGAEPNQNSVIAGQTLESIAIDPDQSSGLDPRIHVIICCTDTPNFDTAVIQALMGRMGQMGGDRQMLFDFAQPANDIPEIWGALDDVVMGGVSQSGFRLGQSVAEFSGIVSTANSGGFASVRTRNLAPALNLSEFDGIELRLKGDGQRYKFMLRSETRWDGVAYCRSFDTVADQWITVRIPFTELVPVFRARTIANSPFDASSVCALQLMLSKFEYDGALNPHFQAGAFRLQVQSIQVYRQAPPLRWVLVDSGNQSHWQPQPAFKQAGVPYTILSAATVTDRPGGQPLRIDRHPISGEVSAADVAALCVAVLNQPKSLNQTLFVATGSTDCAPRDWDCLFQTWPNS